MGLEQDETHAGHEACRGSYSQLVVGSEPEVPPFVSSTHLGSGLHRDQAMSLRCREALQVGAPAIMSLSLDRRRQQAEG